MTNFLNRTRIPTILGLAIIVFGMASGIYLTLHQQNLPTKAAGSLLPKDSDIKITNIEDTKVSISWKTADKAEGYIQYFTEGEEPRTKLDDNEGKLKESILHHISLIELTPKTTYQFKIVSGNAATAYHQFTTAPESNSKNEFGSIIGSVLDNDHFLESGLVYLEIPGAATESGIIKSLGNFILPLAKIRTADLSDIFKDTAAQGSLTIISESGQQAKAKIALNKVNNPIGPLKLGQELDLTPPEASPSSLEKFDLNSDGIINSADASTILDNFGKNPKVPRSDLNGDGVVDKKDMDLILDEMAKLGNQ